MEKIISALKETLMDLSKYDLVLPIGERCHMYYALKKFCPEIHLHIFDSLGGISLKIAYRALRTKFKDFLPKENLEVINNGDGNDYFVKDKQTGVRCSHLFKTSLAPAESLDRYYPILERLVAGTIREIGNAKTMLFCHATNAFTYKKWQIRRYVRKFRRLFPDKKIDFVFFVYNEKQQNYEQIYNKKGIVIIEITKPEIAPDDINNMACWSNESVFHVAVKSFLDA